MFERLASKLLSRLLSKYFVQEDEGSNGKQRRKRRPSSVGVWSGYVSFENLTVRKEIVNDYLKAKGIPFELVHCNLGRVEITVPWAKMGSRSSSPRKRYSPSRNDVVFEEEAVIVLVVDGTHALFRTNYTFDDEALRQAALVERRQQLEESLLAVDNTTNDESSSSSSGIGHFFKKRLAGGILKDILEKLHIHIRNVHIRLEDIESDSSNPFACGLTLESLHVHAEVENENENSASKLVIPETNDADLDDDYAISKVAQLNHFSLYWNALDYHENLPPEYSVLQNLKSGELTQYLDRCIDRRSTNVAPSLQSSPNHSYVLRPLDVTCLVVLSTSPRNLDLRPALVATIQVPELAVEVRDYQCAQIMELLSSLKEYNFAKQYRLYRPRSSVMEDPRAWWKYSFRVISMELRESNMRWSWQRFCQDLELRRRYCELYERKMQYPETRPISRVTSRVDLEQAALENSTPDDGAGPSQLDVSRPRGNLSLQEALELQEMEDGLRGDLSIRDIVIFRALVDARVAGIGPTTSSGTTSTIKRMMSSMVSEDVKTDDEYERLIAYVESSTAEKNIEVDHEKESLIAVSIQTQLTKACIAFYSPLPSTADLNQHRRLHERFLELSISDLTLSYSILGNYMSFILDAGVGDFIGSEIRSNANEHLVVSRPPSRDLQFDSDPVSPISDDNTKFVSIQMTGNPIENPHCDSGINACVEKLEVLLPPESEWLLKLKRLLDSIPSSSKLSQDAAAFWENLSMARINSYRYNTGVAELRAKLDAAIFNHKNVDLDIRIDSPILRIGDGNSGELVVDLGQALMTTERLAGVAAKNLKQSGFTEMKRKSEVLATAKVTAIEQHSGSDAQTFDGSEGTPQPSTTLENASGPVPDLSSPMRGLNNFFLGSSAMSVDSGRLWGRALSYRQADSTRLSFGDRDGDRQPPSQDLLHSCFYDEFRLRLFGGTITYHGSVLGDRVEIVEELAVSITLDKSVIPSDHTLYRLKTSCVVEKVAVHVSYALISQISDLATVWTEALHNESSGVARMSTPGHVKGRMSIRSELRLRGSSSLPDLNEASSDASSDLDESEFLDALENEIPDESTSYEPWLPDVEASHGDGFAASLAYKRRRTPSVSDVSSVSDGSFRASRRLRRDMYLSAENLARLDEQGPEEESSSESEILSDDSFHSALSFRGHSELLEALQEDILETEAEISSLRESIVTLSEPSVKLSLDEAQSRKQRRHLLKIERMRLEAQLRALRAAHEDLVSQGNDLQQDSNESQLDEFVSPRPSTSDLDDAETPRRLSQGARPFQGPAAAHAKALLRAKKQATHKDEEDQGFQHSITRGLDRALFRSSLTLVSIAIYVDNVQNKGTDEDQGESTNCELFLSKFFLTVHRSSRSAKIGASVDRVTISSIKASQPAMRHCIFNGGIQPSLFSTLLPHEFPHYVSSATVENRFFLFSLELGSPWTKDRLPSFATVKTRIAIGDIELAPDSNFLPPIVSFVGRIKKSFLTTGTRNTTTRRSPSQKPFIADYVCSALMTTSSESTGTRRSRNYADLSVRLSAIRLRLIHKEATIGAVVISDTSARFGRAITPMVHKCRCQLDFRCGNVQLLEIIKSEPNNARELFGRRDPYNSLVQTRLRIQLVPSSQETAGWVVNCKPPNHDDLTPSVKKWNFHLGMKVQSIYFIVEREAYVSLIEGATNVAAVLSSSLSENDNDHGADLPSDVMHDAESALVPRAVSHLEKEGPAHQLCWRVDVIFVNLSAVSPIQHPKDWTLTESFGSAFLSFSLNACMVESELAEQSLLCRCDVVDLGVTRSSDDWPILEPVTITSEVAFKSHSLNRTSFPPNKFNVGAGAPWKEFQPLTTQDTRDTALGSGSKWTPHRTMSVAIVIDPVKINLSPASCCLLTYTAQRLVDSNKQADSSDHRARPTLAEESKVESLDSAPSAYIGVQLQSFETKLCLESPKGGTYSNAERLSSLALKNVSVSSHFGSGGANAKVEIGKLSLYDLSTRPGVRVIGREYEKEGSSDEHPPFLVSSVRAVKSGGRFSTDFLLRWGKIQCILLPSTLRSTLAFHNLMQEQLDKPANAESHPHEDIPATSNSQSKDLFDLPFNVHRITFSLQAEAFECILPSRDILTHIRERSQEPIGVVSFRWQADLAGSLSVANVTSTEARGMLRIIDSAGSVASASGPSLEAQEYWDDLIVDQQQSPDISDAGEAKVDGAPMEEGPHLSGVVNSKVSLDVKNFRAVRTSLARLVRRTREHSGAKMIPFCYVVDPPSAGEQRITNQIDFDLVYRLAGTSIEAPDGPKLELNSHQSHYKISQAFQLEVDSVDVLLYIQQSDGGMSDAWKVTLMPMLELFSNPQEQDRKLPSGGDQRVQSDSSLVDVLKSATTIGSVQAKGFQVTFVPGGATQLTRSPIVKCSFANFALGMGMIPSPKDGVNSPLVVRSIAAAEQEGLKDRGISASSSHLVAGVWLSCDIEAKYHNRRLAAWEPAVEPWTLDSRVGLDLMQLLQMKPLGSVDMSLVSMDTTQSPVSMTGVIPDALHERAGEKIRDVVRLLRSQFSANQAFAEESDPNTVETHADLCFLLLSSMEPAMVGLTFYPKLRQSVQVIAPTPFSRQRKIALLPGRSVIEWLCQFGYPINNGIDESNASSIAVSISDEKPLNVNLTGALVENVLGYVNQSKEEKQRSRPLAPHWIRNESGMQIRFQEVLQSERIRKAEKARKTILSNGTEIPITLKREVSQSHDPQRGYIWLEVGGFEDTVGRFQDQEFDIPKGSLGASFRYKIVEKIAVDTVGVHRLPLTLNKHRRDQARSEKSNRPLGWIIVRVEVRVGIKVVTVESPLFLRNTSNSNLIVEIRDRGVGLPLIWRSILPKLPSVSSHIGATKSDGSFVPVPVDIVPTIDDGTSFISITALTKDSAVQHETEISGAAQSHAIKVSAPPRYSQKSIKRGVLAVEELSLTPMRSYSRSEVVEKSLFLETVHLNVCSVRIGMMPFGEMPVNNTSRQREGVNNPEQRMLLLRPPFVIKNFLPVSILVQVRAKTVSAVRRKSNAVKPNGLSNIFDESRDVPSDILSPNEWVELGILSCGGAISWTGALSSSKVDVRVKLCDEDGNPSLEFPEWSTAVVIPSTDSTGTKKLETNPDSAATSKLEVKDAHGTPHHLSVSLKQQATEKDREPPSHGSMSMRSFSLRLSEGSRVVSVYVPFWIVDSTQRDLEFISNNSVAGQHYSNRRSGQHRPGSMALMKRPTPAHGLAELMEDEKLHVQARIPFEVLMIGDERASRLSVRMNVSRLVDDQTTPGETPWSDPISLRGAINSFQDVDVFPSTVTGVHGHGSTPHTQEPFAFRSRIVIAPDMFGGKHGTRLVHIVNRYVVINKLNRVVEILPEHNHAVPCTIGVEEHPIPLHFDDSRRIRIRPKEFGWAWSGPVSVKRKRREVLLRLRHKLKGNVIIVSMEFHKGRNSPSNVIILRLASHPPFRVENHTMHPLHFGQSSTYIKDEYSLDTVLLPCHSVDYAWDEPDERYRAIVVSFADLGYSGEPRPFSHSMLLGSFDMERTTPGTDLRLRNSSFDGRVVADGPTRVLQITDASLPRLAAGGSGNLNTFNQSEGSPHVSLLLDVKLSHGIGISVVDWTPQELLYARVEGISIEASTNSARESVSFALGSITVDNQLWVTPYPVLFRMGLSTKDKVASTGLVEKRRKRRHNAISLSWSRVLNLQGGSGDLTLLNDVELTMEPVVLRVDGVLSDLIWTMVSQALEFSPSKRESTVHQRSRDIELHNVLDGFSYSDVTKQENNSLKQAATRVSFNELYDVFSDELFLATAAMAAKRQRYEKRELSTSTVYGKSGKRGSKSKSENSVSVSNARRKFYIEKLKISTIKTDISWSGALPAALFSFFGVVRPALTFEGFPLLLRQYTTSHAYGSADDLMQSLRHHYLSVWRILDVVVGVAFKPTFLVRAFIFTTRESIATMFERMSQALLASGRVLLAASQSPVDAVPTYEEGELVARSGRTGNGMTMRSVLAVPGTLLSSTLTKSAYIMSAFASLFQYGGTGYMSRQGYMSGSLRSRNPRLFENIDGRDLLVEYVQGENAGNALLSRVRGGIYLGEGYTFHVEGVRVSENGDTSGLESENMILMLTSDRVLLLNGDRYKNFCAVVWEETFDNVVHFERDESIEAKATSEVVSIWFLVDGLSSLQSDELMSRYASAMVSSSSDGGLDVLQSKTLLVPSGNGEIICDKVQRALRRAKENDT